MNAEAIETILNGFVLTILCIALGWEVFVDYPKWFMRYRRADELLLAVLTQEQYCQLKRRGYVDIKSPRDQERIYLVPRSPGLVRVIEQGRPKESLCLQPLERVPNADVVAIHKLMIEADEETYLQTANKLTPITSCGWDDLAWVRLFAYREVACKGHT